MKTSSDKKDQILKTTLRLITERGFHDTPMSLVAREAGVAAGTIYHHFSNKDALINELYSSLKVRMGRALLSKYHAEGNIKQRFFSFWLGLYEHFVEHPLEFKFLEQYANSPLVDRDVRYANSVHYQPIIDFLEHGIRQGVLREMPLLLMSNLIYGHITSTAKLQLSGDLDITDENLHMAIQASWDGVKIN